MEKIGKLGNLGELKHLNRDAWIVMAINSVVDKQNEVIDCLNQDYKKTEAEEFNEYIGGIDLEGEPELVRAVYMLAYEISKLKY